MRVNEYLSALGLPVLFEIDSDFKETFRSRYRDSFSYESFSRGQRDRIDFAILLTWRDVASKLSSVSSNLLVIDEFASKLDDDGLETFSDMIRTITEMGTNVICITPRENPKLDLARKVKINYTGGFSNLVEASA